MSEKPRIHSLPDFGIVHLWWVPTDLSHHELSQGEKLLSHSELERANRFRFPRDRSRWIASRSLLRTVLASYLFVPPDSLTFSYGTQGKPYLVGSDHLEEERLAFNISHSENIAVFAIARGCEIGVDVEKIREDIPFEELAGICLSPEERVLLLGGSTPEILPQFFERWVCKEAYLKASGQGLMVTQPNRLTVTFSPVEEDRRLAVITEPGAYPAIVTLLPLRERFVCAVSGLHRSGESIPMTVQLLNTAGLLT